MKVHRSYYGGEGDTVKKILIVLVVITWHPLWGEDAFERHCIACHKTLPSTLQQIFKRYLLVYSGEKNVKASIKHYLKYPSRSISVMSDLFLDSYGIKKKTILDDKALDEAVDRYWEKYKVFGRLK